MSTQESPDSTPQKPTNNPLLRTSHPLVTDLEQEVLDEYARLLGNVNTLSTKLAELAGSPASITLDGLRNLERQTATVCTLLKASVYSIVLQQQIINESEEQQQQLQLQQEQERQGHGQGYEGEEERGGFGGDVSFEGGYM